MARVQAISEAYRLSVIEQMLAQLPLEFLGVMAACHNFDFNAAQAQGCGRLSSGARWNGAWCPPTPTRTEATIMSSTRLSDSCPPYSENHWAEPFAGPGTSRWAGN